MSGIELMLELTLNKIWNNLHSIIEMSCEMIWSDIKSVSKQVYHIYQLGNDIDVKVDKLSNGNGINCPLSDEEKEARERQLYMMEHYDFSEYSSSKTYYHNEINHLRDENGLPFELRKDIKSK